jgi:hypothetical protein
VSVSPATIEKTETSRGARFLHRAAPDLASALSAKGWMTYSDPIEVDFARRPTVEWHRAAVGKGSGGP